MAELKLLPCPWCTEAAQIVNRKRYRKYVVLCDNADCVVRPSTPECDAEAEAIAAWNTRPAPPLTPELIERVLKFVGDEQLRALPTVKVQP